MGKKTAQGLRELAYGDIRDLAGEVPEKMYENDCRRRGVLIDHCQPYVCRLAVYYAENPLRDPEKLNWWYWKDKTYP